MVNAGFAFAQEYRADRAAQRLEELLPVRATVLRDGVRLNIALTRRLEAPWIERIESYGPRWNAHRFVVRTTTDVDAIVELPAIVCEGYRDLGMQESLRARSRGTDR